MFRRSLRLWGILIISATLRVQGENVDLDSHTEVNENQEKGRKIYGEIDGTIEEIKRHIFQIGRKWKYKAFFINSVGDTLNSQIVTLMIPEPFFYRQIYKIGIEWRYDEKKEYHGTPGAIETESQCFLHPPEIGRFCFTQLAGFLWVHKPLKKGEGWRTSFDANEKILVKQCYKVIGQKDISTLLREFPKCWQVDVRAESKAGVYKATFYFHPEYGFVRWEYTKPDGEQVIFDLEKVSGFEE